MGKTVKKSAATTRFEREAKALQKNLAKRKLQLEGRKQKLLKQKTGTENG